MNRKIALSKKSKRTTDELLEASKHLIWNMRYLSERLDLFLYYSNMANNAELSGLLYSIHDSFLIRSRKMIEFFYPSSRIYDNDLIATDFFPNNDTWKMIRPPQPDILRTTKLNIGGLLAHLTYQTKGHPTGEVTWNTSDIYVGIFNALQNFLNSVDSSLLDKKVDYLSVDNPNIIICYPIFPPKGNAPYQIMSIRDKASGIKMDF